MNKALKILLLLALAMMALGIASCSDDDDDGGPVTPPVETDPWIGSWISAGANVAPLVYMAPVNTDTVIVELNENNTVTLTQHNWDTDVWSTNSGTYGITESDSGNIHAISLSYTNPAYDQVGIVEVVEGTPDILKLEVVISTYPTQPTVQGGFEADPALWFDDGTNPPYYLNLQTYVRQ